MHQVQTVTIIRVTEECQWWWGAAANPSAMMSKMTEAPQGRCGCLLLPRVAKYTGDAQSPDTLQ
jgi:hypothetical protein